MTRLSEKHRNMLTEESGISDAVIEARGYRTETTKRGLERLGFSNRQQRTPALLIPVYGPLGEVVQYQIRPDEPRVSRMRSKPIKYETPAGSTMRFDVNPTTRQHIGDPDIPLWITEGIKKGDALATLGLCVVALIGVWNWRGKNDLGGKTALADWESVALDGRDVFIVFDSDVMLKEGVHLALSRLSEFLKSRGARVRFVYLPDNGDGKTGVDDYLVAGNTLQDLQALATTTLRPAPKQEERQQGQYVVEDGCLARVKQTRDGPVTEKLCNFDARIRAQDILDDGAERTLSFEIEGTLASGQPLPTINVPASRFGGMAWTADQWGLHAVVFAGSTNRDHLRVAMQTRSLDDAEQRVTYGHTGWREVEEGRWAYLNPSGAIFDTGLDETVRVDPGSNLSRYHLPQVPHPRLRKDALRASLELLDLAPHSITAPLLASAYRAILGRVDFSVNLYGWSGEGKTQLALLILKHFGAEFTEEQLLGWTSTANALEETLFRTKDAVVVIDDFAPSSDEYQARRQRATVERTIRSAANSSARRRARPDGTVKVERPPRGLVLMTGEEAPSGFSVNARLLTLELPKGTIRPLSRLTKHQEAAEAGLFAAAMSAWVHHLASDFPAKRSAFEAGWKAKREELEAAHGRITSTAAQLLVAADLLVNFAAEAGAVTGAEITLTREKFEAGILTAMNAQAEHLAASNPIDEFLNLLLAALRARRCHLEARNAGYSHAAPSDAQAWGWSDSGTPGGTRIGWVDDPEVLLDPEATYAEVQRFAREQGTTLPLGKTTLWKRLAEHGIIQREGRHLKPKVSISGKRVRVLRFPFGIPDRSGASGAGGTSAVQNEPFPRPTSEISAGQNPEEVGQRPTPGAEVGRAGMPSQTRNRADAPLAPHSPATPPAESAVAVTADPPCEATYNLAQLENDIEKDAPHLAEAGRNANGVVLSSLRGYLRRQHADGTLPEVAPALFAHNPDLAERYRGAP